MGLGGPTRDSHRDEFPAEDQLAFDRLWEQGIAYQGRQCWHCTGYLIRCSTAEDENFAPLQVEIYV
jgi:hypothetical protein